MWGASPELGTTEKGKLADLVLLNADALADITNKKINPYESAGHAGSRTVWRFPLILQTSVNEVFRMQRSMNEVSICYPKPALSKNSWL